MAKNQNENEVKAPDYKALYESSLREIEALNKKVNRDAKEQAEFERKVGEGEKIVSVLESEALQREGLAEVVAIFIEKGVKVHKVKMIKKEAQNEKVVE